MAQTYSGPGTVLLGGQPVLQLTSATLAIDSGNSDVITLAEGWAGQSLGPNTCTISGQGPIPVDGIEIDWPGLIARGQPLSIGYVIGGKTYSTTSYITQCNFKTDRSSPNEQGFEAKGKITALPL